MAKWSEEKVWDWYDRVGWLRGCNFMPSNCANRIDMYQNYDWEDHYKCAEEELALAHELGFNSIRIILDFTVWMEEHDDCLKHIDAYLELCEKNEITAMITLGNDCCTPKNELYVEPHVGEQKYDWGYHGGRKYSQHSNIPQMGFSPLDEPETREKFYEFIREIITRYKEDERVCVWDLYNEVGNNRRDAVSLPHLKKFFEIAWEINPIQPLTACVWRGIVGGVDNMNECEKFAIENSDVISYHCYGNIEENVKRIRFLKKYNRPIFNTEWLGRTLGSNVFDLFPMFYLEKVSCYNWGFVAGKYQTYEPWNGTWEDYESGKNTNVDFTKWFHDLYRPSLRPYDPKETELMRRICNLADEDMNKNIPHNKNVSEQEICEY